MIKFQKGDILISKITNNRYIIKKNLDHGIMVNSFNQLEIKFISNSAIHEFYKKCTLKEILLLL